MDQSLESQSKKEAPSRTSLSPKGLRKQQQPQQPLLMAEPALAARILTGMRSNVEPPTGTPAERQRKLPNKRPKTPEPSPIRRLDHARKFLVLAQQDLLWEVIQEMEGPRDLPELTRVLAALQALLGPSQSPRTQSLYRKYERVERAKERVRQAKEAARTARTTQKSTQNKSE